MNNNRESSGDARGVSSRDYVFTAMQVAGVLGAIFPPERHPEGNDAMVENGGNVEHNPVDLQPAYHGHVQNATVNVPDLPQLHLSDDIFDLYTEYMEHQENGVAGDGANGVSGDAPTLEEPSTSKAVTSPVPSSSGRSMKKSQYISSDDYDSDFEEAPKKSGSKPRSQEMPRAPRCTPQSSTTHPRVGVRITKVAGHGKVEAAPSTAAGPSTTCYQVKPISLPPQAEEKSSELRALLTGQRALSGKGKQTAKKQNNANRRVTKRAPAKVNVVSNIVVQKKMASSTSASTAPGAGCSGVVLPTTSASEKKSERISIQDSDSESEFAIFSQEDDRRLFKKFYKRRRQIRRECERNNEIIQEAERSLAAERENLLSVDAALLVAEAECQRADDELRRIEEERRRIEEARQQAGNEFRRLEERRRTIVAAIENSTETIETHRGTLEKATKKTKLLDRKN